MAIGSILAYTTFAPYGEYGLAGVPGDGLVAGRSPAGGHHHLVVVVPVGNRNEQIRKVFSPEKEKSNNVLV